MKTKRAVILCSGGLDSTVAAAEARAAGFDLYILSINYGQRHLVELRGVPEIARGLGAKDSLVIDLNLRAIGGSALTADMPVPKDQPKGDTGRHIPTTYVPARNTIFLSLALGWAEVIEADRIYLGANVLDYSGYPDCRPEFLEAFNRLALVGTRAGVAGHPIHIEAPLLKMSKAEIIQRGIVLQAPLHLTHSCYDPDDAGRSCGRCDSCRLRLKGFAEAGVPDPASYILSDKTEQATLQKEQI